MIPQKEVIPWSTIKEIWKKAIKHFTKQETPKQSETTISEKSLKIATQTETPKECEHCQGHGYTAEHNPEDPHENGECAGFCPIQVQCEHCEATGKTPKENN